MRETTETYELCASLLDLGANGGQPREWLTDEHPGVRGCAALAPALADDPQAVKVLTRLCVAPRAFDRSLGYGLDPASPALPYFAGPPRWTLIAAACARVSDLRDLDQGARMALPRAFRTALCPDFEPYLRAVFPQGWPTASVDATTTQRTIACHVAERDELWQAEGETRTRVLRALELPVERAAWLELVKGPRRSVAEYSAADIVVLEGKMAIRCRPTIYVGVDRTHPEMPRRLFENLLDAHAEAVAEGRIDGYHLTIDSDACAVLTVDGVALSVDRGPGTWSPEFTNMFTSCHWCRYEEAEQLCRMSAFCSTVSAETWYDGRRYAQDFADMAAIGPVRPTGPAEGKGYRAVLELDTEWLPPGTAVPRGLDSRPHVTDLRPPT
ncbi:hypothetical protein AB0B66_41565 [Catellatospora sp. NPDC049111]|uniref:hypothetical protein n=1 Tax=Catellatospora sp. NPDC049111 TaxID=3155271 RepID=UPI0033E5742A